MPVGGRKGAVAEGGARENLTVPFLNTKTASDVTASSADWLQSPVTKYFFLSNQPV